MSTSLFRAAATTVTGLAVLLAGAPAVSADTNPEGTLAVDVLERSVRLSSGGEVVVPVRARCAPHLDAFELDVTVLQRGRIGATSTVGGDFPVCDGEWHRTVVEVTAEDGRFRPGRVRIDVFLGAFDTVTGSDTSAEDHALAPARPRSSG